MPQPGHAKRQSQTIPCHLSMAPRTNLQIWGGRGSQLDDDDRKTTLVSVMQTVDWVEKVAPRARRSSRRNPPKYKLSFTRSRRNFAMEKATLQMTMATRSLSGVMTSFDALFDYIFFSSCFGLYTHPHAKGMVYISS